MKTGIVSILKNTTVLFLYVFLFVCASDNGNTAITTLKNYTVTIYPKQTNQTMIGFGGGLTWYSDRIIFSPKKNEILKILFDDLGADIIRLKNWYYPVNYPTTKSPDIMEVSWFKNIFTTTNELYSVAKSYNPNIQTLFCSWGPPSSLKSNSILNEGTLKKESDAFMYDDFASYWVDVLDHISFNPDYISMQNEPAYVTKDWATCEWRPEETPAFPGYARAFDKVYEKIKDRPNAPIMVGPESENLGNSSFGNTFTTFADQIKDKPSLGMYAYHMYNFNETTSSDEIVSTLEMIKNNYGNKPNMMTEYSIGSVSWLQTAVLIHNVMVHANASAYIYWHMVWDVNTTAMITIDNSGNYQQSPYYYVMKHFAKHIDKGYKRINISSENSNLKISGYLNTTQREVTLVIINPSLDDINIKNLMDGNSTATLFTVEQSTAGVYFKDIKSASSVRHITLPKESITTVVFKL